VDFACAFLIFSSLTKASNWSLCILLYNFCAFAMQMPLGILADTWNRNSLFAAIGCILVGAAYGVGHFPVAAVIIAGIGNAMFHIGGGIDVLNISEEKSGALGVFVAPGALGIYFGTMLGFGDNMSAIPVIAALFAAAGFICITYRLQGGTYPGNAAFSLDNSGSSRILIAAICLFLVVCLRSYVGFIFNYHWKAIDSLAITLVCAVVLGKTIGGFAADRFGMRKTAFISLSLAALLFILSSIPLVGIPAVFIFNITMPITLWVIASIFPRAKGFSFGLLSFALFLGFLPTYWGFNLLTNSSWGIALVAAVSLVLLVMGLRKVDL
jgi:FSR family fosmidomycin resistance protein-like MFS transporter